MRPPRGGGLCRVTTMFCKKRRVNSRARVSAVENSSNALRDKALRVAHVADVRNGRRRYTSHLSLISEAIHRRYTSASTACPEAYPHCRRCTTLVGDVRACRISPPVPLSRPKSTSSPCFSRLSGQSVTPSSVGDIRNRPENVGDIRAQRAPQKRLLPFRIQSCMGINNYID